MDKPLVSFCLLTYNQEEYIKEAIEGVFSQTYSPLEIIISDDCSTDRTFEIIQENVKKYNGTHKILLNRNKYNLGLVEHFNKILYEVSNGDYVALAAGDDISLPDRILKSVTFLSKKPDVCALSTSLYVIDKNSNFKEKQRIDTNSDVVMDSSHFLSDEYKHINGPSRIISRKLIKAFPRLNTNCQTEDTTLLLRAFLFGKVGLLADKLVKYRVHDNNISSPEGLRKMKIDNIFNQYYDDINMSLKKSYITEDEHMKYLERIKKNKIDRNSKTKKDIDNNLNFSKTISNIIKSFISSK